MPNLQGTSPVGRDGGGCSYVARMPNRSRPGQATSWDGEILGARRSSNGHESEAGAGLWDARDEG